MSTQHIVQLLEKMSSFDKDFRYMALNDLMSQLSKDAFKMDERLERKVVTSVLKLLEDKNSEVQNLAVNCIAVLIPRISDELIDEVVKSLTKLVLSGDEKLRDISSIGLKSVINTIAPDSIAVQSICSHVVTPLLGALGLPDESVVIEVLDLLGDVLLRFGSRLVADHARLQGALVPMLSHARPVIRKRAISVIANLVPSINDELFEALINNLIQSLSKSAKGSSARTAILALATIAREGGERVGLCFDRAVPLVFASAKVEEDDELRETCLQALHDFALHASKAFAPFVAQTLDACLVYIKHDPNYNYDSDGEAEDMDVSGGESGGSGGEEEEEEEYSDDDDVSWRVRKGASRCIAAIIRSRPDLLKDMYAKVSPALITRFKEREENVRVDVLDTYVLILKQTAAVPALGADAMADDSHPSALLAAVVPGIVKSLHKQLKDKSVKIRCGVLALLAELVVARPNALAAHLGELLPGALFCISDKSSNSDVKMAVLGFLARVLKTHSAEAVQAHASALTKIVVAAIKDSFYKITSEGLAVATQLVLLLRTDFAAPLSAADAASVRLLCDATSARFNAADTAQEVKDKAMTAMAQLVASAGDSLTKESAACLPVFLQRLDNEVTRITATKCLSSIVTSPLNIDISAIVNQAIEQLTSFLRKNSRPLRLVSLSTLQVILRTRGTGLQASLFQGLLSELHQLISEEDMQASQLALSLATLCISENSTYAAFAASDPALLPGVLALAVSPLLQGATLDAALGFLRALASSGAPGVTVDGLIQRLTAPALAQALPKQAYNNIAKGVAAVAELNPASTSALIATSLSNIASAEENVKLLSLLIVGELGRTIDLSGDGDKVLAAVLGSFQQASEDVKTAASVALGNICSGNLSRFLPFVVSKLESQPAIQFLLLQALKVAIGNFVDNAARMEELAPFVQTIWGLLFKHCENPEEGTRNTVSECLGKLAVVDPENLISLLTSNLDAPSAFTRGTVIAAIKAAVSSKHRAAEAVLRPALARIFAHISDRDNHVRRVALVAFTTTVHNMPGLVAPVINDFLPNVYAETNVRADLIREVEMGPFKEKVDDGLDTRKSAFECLYTILDSAAAQFDVATFIENALKGLVDHYDIQLVSFVIFARLAQHYPEDVLRRLDDITDKLTVTIDATTKQNAVKQEIEKSDELKRSAVRSIFALKCIPGSDKSQKLAVLVKKVEAVPLLRKRLESLANPEGAGASAASAVAMDTRP